MELNPPEKHYEKYVLVIVILSCLKYETYSGIKSCVQRPKYPNDKLYTIIIIAVSFKTENSKIELGSFNNVGIWD